MIGHLLRSADFERVLGTPTRARSTHFAVHYLPGVPGRPRQAPASVELSTSELPKECLAVDDSVPKGCWLGTVVPKRHAKRAVTRTLLKRQIRGAMALQPRLAHGLWVVRLRTPFDRQRYPSAASEALRQTAREELSALLAQAASRVGN